MDENEILKRITVDPEIFAGKPIVRGRRLAVEHVLGMLAAGDTIETILGAHPWLQQGCVLAVPDLVGPVLATRRSSAAAGRRLETRDGSSNPWRYSGSPSLQ